MSFLCPFIALNQNFQLTVCIILATLQILFMICDHSDFLVLFYLKKNIFPDFNFWGSKKSTCYVIWRWREINWHQLKYLYSFSHGDLRVHNCKCKEEKRWKFVCVCIYLFIYFSVYLHFSHLVAYIFHYYSEKKKKSSQLAWMSSSTLNFSYIDFIVCVLCQSLNWFYVT